MLASSQSSALPGRSLRRPLRLLIVDGHDVVRRGVRNLFETTHGFQVVAEARDGREALRLANESKPDLVILDYMLPSLSGLQLVHAMKRARLEAKVLPDVISSALQAGIRGFVLKSEPETALLEAADALLSGKPYFSAEVSDALLAGALETAPRSPLGALTQRERQIVQLIAEGWMSRQIASQLGITQKTAETHRAGAMRKLKLSTTAGVVRWAIRNNLIEP